MQYTTAVLGLFFWFLLRTVCVSHQSLERSLLFLLLFTSSLSFLSLSPTTLHLPLFLPSPPTTPLPPSPSPLNLSPSPNLHSVIFDCASFLFVISYSRLHSHVCVQWGVSHCIFLSPVMYYQLKPSSLHITPSLTSLPPLWHWTTFPVGCGWT